MASTRRQFLKSSAAATVTFLAPRIACGAVPQRARALVIVQLAGGNDSLNTLVPYTNARYRALRSTLAIPDRELLPVDEHFAFHPALARLVPLFDRKRLALIDGVGFPSLDRSHFRSQDVWQTADEGCGRDHKRRLGWLGRYADHYLGDAGSPLATVAVGNRAPLGLEVNVRRPAVIAELSRFIMPRNGAADELEALRDLYSIPRRDDALTEAIRAHGHDLFRALDAHERTPARPSRVTYPPSRLGQALQNVAAVLDAHPETHAAWVTTGGYDTHAQQAVTHSGLLTDLAASLAAFQSDLEARAIDDRVLLMAWSEFGRRAAENASGGTDHGKGGVVFVLGKHARGGLWGERPDLGRLEDGDLASRVDFRSTYATIIRKWYGRDPEPILGRAFPTLGFL
jgi:uncharacterized protein (DUF1501 family)